MGSASEYIQFLNMDVLPIPAERKETFVHLDITPEMMKERRAYRSMLRKQLRDRTQERLKKSI